MAVGDVETVPVEGGWTNRIQGERRGPNTTFASREEAVAAGREIARFRHVGHVVLEPDPAAA